MTFEFLCSGTVKFQWENLKIILLEMYTAILSFSNLTWLKLQESYKEHIEPVRKQGLAEQPVLIR